jgi:hypothetical protein
MSVADIIHAVIIYNHNVAQNGSTENGTIHETKMLAVIRNRLYLCSAFETQVQNIE